MKPIYYSNESVREINSHFVYNIEKFYRMNGCLTSDLVKVEDNVAYLEIILYPRWKRSPKEAAGRMVNERCRFDSRIRLLNLWKVMVFDERTSSHQDNDQEAHTKVYEFIFFVFHHNLN